MRGERGSGTTETGAAEDDERGDRVEVTHADAAASDRPDDAEGMSGEPPPP